MNQRNKAIVHRLILENNNNTSCFHQTRSNFKKRLNHSNRSEDYLPVNNANNNAQSHKNIIRKKCQTNFVPIPSLAELRKQVYIPSSKVFSQNFIGKIFDKDKSSFAVIKYRKEDQQSRDYSPRSIKQCLQQKIMENVRRHKQKQRLPKISKVIMTQKNEDKNYTEEEVHKDQEKFVIWQKKQKDEIVRISIKEPSQSLFTDRAKRSSKQIDKSQQLSLRKRQKYAYYKDFRPLTKADEKQQI